MIGRSREPNRRAARTRACVLGVALTLAGCGDTLQTQPIPHNTLETLLVAPYPIYWLGHSFSGLALTEATKDPSGAFSMQYGTCKQGGQGTCVPPLRLVTSPDNSFLPGGSAARTVVTIRGVRGLLTPDRRTVVIAAGGVVVGIYALDARLAAAAAESVVPINDIGWPGAELPAALPDTGFGELPLPAQMASPLAPLR
jgi:hypothetical protein